MRSWLVPFFVAVTRTFATAPPDGSVTVPPRPPVAAGSAWVTAAPRNEIAQPVKNKTASIRHVNRLCTVLRPVLFAQFKVFETFSACPTAVDESAGCRVWGRFNLAILKETPEVQYDLSQIISRNSWSFD